jgi:hypothetical protein
VDGQFQHLWQFQVSPNNGGSASITNSSVDFNITGRIDKFSAIIDNTFELILTQTKEMGIVSTLSGVFGKLSSGPNDNHFLVVRGIANNASYGGNININPVNAVPVPAAVWLFGSAFAGLIGLAKRIRNHGI